jgi:hypothetical protein
MTNEAGGLTGYGYTNQGNRILEPRSAESGQAPEPAGASAAETGAPPPVSGNGSGSAGSLHESASDGTAAATASADDHAEIAEQVVLDRSDEIAGYEPSASTCINRGREIAQSLNHMSLSVDHLMLALTMDQNARRLLERVGDVTQLREAAMQRLGHYASARSGGEQNLSPTADLADIAKSARDAANEREQSVALSDLINAFPKLNGRLTYGTGDNFRATALMERIEQGLVPRVADSMSRIETVVVEAIQQGQTVQRMLQDLNSRQTYEAEKRQIEFMEDVRRHVREAIDSQVGAALQEINDTLNRKIDELKQATEPKPPAPAEADGFDPGHGPLGQMETDDELSCRGQETAGVRSHTEEVPKKTSRWGWVPLI